MQLSAEPKLSEPILMAAWPGMGLVALKTVAFLVERLGAEPLARVAPESRFAVSGIAIEDGIVAPTTLPESRLFFHQTDGRHDLLLFVGAEQPVSGQEWSLANEVLKTAERLGAKRLYTFAAMPCRIDHHREPKVWGCATDEALLRELERHDVTRMKDGSVTGLNGVLLGVAQHRGWAGCCLLGEIPVYATQMENPKSCHAVLKRVCSLTGLDLDLEELRIQGEAMAAQLDVIFRKLGQSSEQDADVDEDADDGSDEEPILN